jgi:hypothetical protein
VIENTIDLCNQKVFEDQRSNAELDGMATTIALVVVEGNRAVVAHVGDSRVYRFDEQGLICLTEDHSEVGEAVRAGMLTPEQAAKHPRRNVISRAIGADINVEPDFREIEIDENTSFILCTDGITRHITDDEIARLMRSSDRPQTICETMKRLCFEGGAEDNLTAIIVDFGGRKYVGEQTRPRVTARAAQAPASAPPPPALPPAVKPRIELDLKPPALSGPLRKPTPPPQVETARPAVEQTAANQIAVEQTAANPVAESPASPAVKKKPSLGTKELTIKVPTVRMPQKDEMSRTMKMSLLGGAVLVGIVIGLLLGGRYGNPFSRFLAGDPYEGRSGVRRPGDADVASAFALHLEGRSTESLKQLGEILAADPANAEAHFYFGRVSYDQKNYDDAIKHLNEAAKLDPNLQDVWNHLALVYLALGQRSNAMDCIQRAIKSSTPAAPPPAEPSPGSLAPAASPTPVG